MTTKTIYLSSSDYEVLRFIASAASSRALLAELERATRLAPHELPAGIVRLGSRFTLEDGASGERDTYTLVRPEHADAAQGRLSVLAPIGTAVLGYAEGDEIEWPTPGGLRRIRICDVVPPPAIEPVDESNRQ